MKKQIAKGFSNLFLPLTALVHYRFYRHTCMLFVMCFLNNKNRKQQTQNNLETFQDCKIVYLLNFSLYSFRFLHFELLLPPMSQDSVCLYFSKTT